MKTGHLLNIFVVAFSILAVTPGGFTSFNSQEERERTHKNVAVYIKFNKFYNALDDEVKIILPGNIKKVVSIAEKQELLVCPEVRVREGDLLKYKIESHYGSGGVEPQENSQKGEITITPTVKNKATLLFTHIKGKYPGEEESPWFTCQLLGS